VAALVTAGLETVALRVPSHPAMRALLAATGRPLAAPSANLSGSISPTCADHVVRSLGGRIPLILDGGSCEQGLESTIIAATGSGLRLLRAGPLLIDAEPGDGDRIEAPGQLASHYAPAKPLRLEADEASDDEYLIGFGALSGDDNLSAGGDLVEAAANFFAALHRADLAASARIAVASIPARGVGVAINDRLRRAAAPRP
jgi:L-threonylcarbamoyladenylate synthase